MTPERWACMKNLFERALALESHARGEFVRQTCGDDGTLARSVVALLNHHVAATSVLHGPAVTTAELDEIVAEELRTFAPGEIVANRFRIERFLAEGGMGEVYAALDLELNETVALKTIRSMLAADEGILARFKQETQLARKVTHRNVSRVFDLFRHDVDAGDRRRSVVFLSMELLLGDTLAERIRLAGPLHTADAQQIAIQLVEGLEAAHAAGIVHRDFKSANVLLVPELAADGSFIERAVIMDFGLAGTSRNGVHGDFFPDSFAGTPAYMAPEQVESGSVTTATDIYALGIVMFEMIAGTVPFRGESPLETARLRLARDAPALRAVAPTASAVWERAVRACLQCKPENRPRSVIEVAERLTGQFERRRNLRALVLSTCAAAVVAGVTYWARLPYQPKPAAQAMVDNARVKLENITKAGFSEAVGDFQRAIAVDPNWAQAWAELAYAYAAGANAKQLPASEASSKARKAALQAIRLDSRSARAFGALGWVQSLDFDEWPSAESTLRRALSLEPDDAQLHYWLGVHLRKKGKFADAEAEDRTAMRLSHQKDPSIWCEVAFLYWTSGQLGQMDGFMRELLVAHPNFGFTRFLHARLLKEQGRFGEASEELRFSESLQYSFVTVVAERASVAAYRGDVPAARADLDYLTRISASQAVDSLLIAGVYAKLGEFDRALNWLESAYAQRDNTLLSLATSPILKPLHADPRFATLLRRLHFQS